MKKKKIMTFIKLAVLKYFFFIAHTLIFELDFYKSEDLYTYNSKLIKSPKRFIYNIYMHFQLEK